MEKWSEETLRGGDTEIQESQDSLVSGHEIMEEETQRAPGTPVLTLALEVAPETPVEPEIKVALDCLKQWQVLRESEVEALLSRLESFATHKEKLDCLASLQCEQLTKAFKENHKRKLETEEPETHVDPETSAGETPEPVLSEEHLPPEKRLMLEKFMRENLKKR